MIYIKQSLFGLLICISLLVSCKPKVTFTETYYIANSTNREISLEVNNSVVWDTCSTGNIQRAWFDTTTITVQPRKTIRLHPIVRDDRYETSSYDLNIVPIVGTSVMLISGTDSVVWEIKNRQMFTSDTEWSIFNTESWQTVEKESNSYTYDHTFIVTQDKIERSKL